MSTAPEKLNRMDSLLFLSAFLNKQWSVSAFILVTLDTLKEIYCGIPSCANLQFQSR